MRKYQWAFALIFIILIIYSLHLCSLLQGNNTVNLDRYNYDYNEIVSDVYNCNYNRLSDSISLKAIKERAFLMSSVEWVPKTDVINNIGLFKHGVKVVGLPYSSVKELQKFIGLDVSIYTFLTAVGNPHSLFYTEDVAKGNPCYLGGSYSGKNSHTFYGTVCSSFTAFCYGENNNYTSFNYRNGDVPNYYLKPDQSVEGVSAGDLYWCPGHVALITEVERDSLGRVSRVELFESAGDKVYARNYTTGAFKRRMSGNGNSKKQGCLYRNKLIKKSVGEYDDGCNNGGIQLLLDTLSVKNQEICTWFGDRPCVGEWDKLMINFNKKDFDRIIVSLNEEIIDTLDISNVDHSIEYKYKSVGIYKAQLASDSIISPNYTSFEVIDTTTKVSQNDDGSLEVIFADNSEPEIVYWVNKAGEQHTFPITVPGNARLEGKMGIKPCGRKDAVLRVIYRGRFGRAINKPVHLFQK